VLVKSDLASFFKVWGGRISYQEAIDTGVVRVEGNSSLVRAFPQWFGWSATPVRNSKSALQSVGVS
jgi:hypothetical protein